MGRTYVKPMSEIVYSSEPEWCRPRHFLLLAFRDLTGSWNGARALFWADLRVQHRLAWLGYVWLFVPATAAAAVCMFIQSRGIVTIAPTALPYPIFALSGLLLWQTLIEALNAPMETLRASRPILARTMIAHEAVLGSALLRLGFNMIFRVIILMIVGFMLSSQFYSTVPLTPIVFFVTILFGFSIGMLVAPWGVIYDDVPRALTYATTFAFFLSPVIYPMPRVPVLHLNPVVPLLEAARGSLLGQNLSWGVVLIAVISLIVFVFAWLIYRLVRPSLTAAIP